MHDVGVVVIGRNEGERLKRCLRSIPAGLPVVYVDSGSTDGSVAFARSSGAVTVTLDMANPFTAARARNAGASCLFEVAASTEFVQFIDGDCELASAWIEQAREELIASQDLGVVTGRLRERQRMATVYNMMCDVEWDQPAGEIAVCGGIMMVRRAAFEAVCGFNDALIAAEDDDLCLRLGNAGWRLIRLPNDMASHDAAMTNFGQWWQRMVRAGHAFAQIGTLHKGHFSAPRRRAWIFGLVLPVLAIIGLAASLWTPLIIVGLYAASFLKTYQGFRRRLLPIGESATVAAFLTLAKFPNLQGILIYWSKRLRRKDINIIEYK
jgi:GT2 family glycosyltransferase